VPALDQLRGQQMKAFIPGKGLDLRIDDQPGEEKTHQAAKERERPRSSVCELQVPILTWRVGQGHALPIHRLSSQAFQPVSPFVELQSNTGRVATAATGLPPGASIRLLASPACKMQK
jgi:hypothetical protein